MNDDWKGLLNDSYNYTLTTEFDKYLNRYMSRPRAAVPINEQFNSKTYKPLSKQAWNTLCVWTRDVIIIDNYQVDISYGNRQKSIIRITITSILANVPVNEDRLEFTLNENDIDVLVIPDKISNILKRIWDEKNYDKLVNQVLTYYNNTQLL